MTTDHDDTLADIIELLDWLAENVDRIPMHRRAHARLVLERAERLVDVESLVGDHPVGPGPALDSYNSERPGGSRSAPAGDNRKGSR